MKNLILAACLILSAVACDDGAPLTIDRPYWSFVSPLDDGATTGVHVRWLDPVGADCDSTLILFVTGETADGAVVIDSGADGSVLFCNGGGTGLRDAGYFEAVAPGTGPIEITIDVYGPGPELRRWAATETIPPVASGTVTGVELEPLEL